MTTPPPLLVLKARAEARARLFDAGDYECLDEAIAPLLLFAFNQGLDEGVSINVILTAFEGRSDQL